MSKSTANAVVGQQQSKRGRFSKQQLVEALEALAQRRDAADAKAAELSAKLEEIKAKLVKAEGDVAMLRSDEAAIRPCSPCSPGGQPAVEAVMPNREGILFCWICQSDAAYKVGFGGQDVSGKKLTLTKFADGTKRTVTETDNGELLCDCIHHTERGQNAKPCRHKRAIKAVKQLFATCGPKYTPAPTGASAAEQPPVKRTPWAVIEEEANDCMRVSA